MPLQEKDECIRAGSSIHDVQTSHETRHETYNTTLNPSLISRFSSPFPRFPLSPLPPARPTDPSHSPSHTTSPNPLYRQRRVLFSVMGCGAMVQWCAGAVVRRCSGAPVPW